ncbi:MAG: 4-hydroxythreonine-4-phosphate dehydrogenase PdxA [Deltaproteobacteria bacterium]
MKTPRLAITLGDPTGIGAEVTLGALRKRPRLAAQVVLVGDAEALGETMQRLGIRTPLTQVSAESLGAGDWPSRGLAVLAPAGVKTLGKRERRPGRPSLAAARTAYASLLSATGLALGGTVDAIVTAPLSKEWLARARLARTGHTEILQKLTGAENVRLMMVGRGLRVVLETSHVALRDVPGLLNIEALCETIALTHRHLRQWWGLRRPRIAVAALNPHAGDGGVYGDEETRILAPAIARARGSRIDVIGPVPGDTLFSDFGPECDAIIALYHDQGLIPVKQRDVHHAVNVTLGLPFVRTSPDHGTAFDRAGKNDADPRSMRAAIDLALELSE